MGLRISGRRLACVALTAGGLLILGPISAAAATQSIDSTGPLTHIGISDQLNCEVNHSGDSSGEFYGDTACGTFLLVGGTLYGPQDVPAGENATTLETHWTAVSQTAKTGSGTSADPYKIVTVVDAGTTGTTGVVVTETDSYVVGQEAYRTDVKVLNGSDSSKSVIVYRAGDCYLQNSDTGFGRVDTATGAVACTVSTAATSRIEQWFPLTSGSRYYEAEYSTGWAKIGAKV